MQMDNTLFNMSKYKEAVICYDKVLNIDPRYVDALSSKGLGIL
jgi:hypothetical protein